MSMPTLEELRQRFKTDDPERLARRKHLLRLMLDAFPEDKQQLTEEGQLEGQLIEARNALRRVLVQRQLAPSKDEHARIDACTDRATLERWLDQAVTAASVSDALK